MARRGLSAGLGERQAIALARRAAETRAWRELEAMLQAQLTSRGDEFLPGPAYLERWGYPVGARGTVVYTN